MTVNGCLPWFVSEEVWYFDELGSFGRERVVLMIGGLLGNIIGIGGVV